jgi:hypothetical protein
MPNPNLKRKGHWIQSLGLLVILADAEFGLFLFRGDLGGRYLESVLFPILIGAVVAFAAFMLWGGTLVRRSTQADALLFGRVTCEMMEAAWRPSAQRGVRLDWTLPWMQPFARTIHNAKKPTTRLSPIERKLLLAEVLANAKAHCRFLAALEGERDEGGVTG